MHRWRAHKQGERREILGKVVVVPADETAIYYSAKLNASHGERMTKTELKAVAISLAEKFPDADIVGITTKIGEDFAVDRRRVGEWIGQIYNAKRWGRDLTIARLSLLGWSQQMIADKFGLEQR